MMIGLPRWLSGKESPYNEGKKQADMSLNPGQKDPLEEGIAIHSSILAWTIPWTEEPGELQSVESQSQT